MLGALSDTPLAGALSSAPPPPRSYSIVSSLLGEFQYLSTVSGGGFAGGWLTRWIADNKIDGELRLPDTLEALRAYTNYLTPTSGLASADTWAGAVLWIRNTLVNWLLIAPLFLGIGCLPMLYVLLPALVATLSPLPARAVQATAALLGLVCLGAAIRAGIRALPTHSHFDPTNPVKPDRGVAVGQNERELLRGVIWPTIAWAMLAPVAVSAVLPFGPRWSSAWQMFWVRDPFTYGSCRFCTRPIVPYFVRHVVASCGWRQWPLWLLPLGPVIVACANRRLRRRTTITFTYGTCLFNPTSSGSPGP